MPRSRSRSSSLTFHVTAQPSTKEIVQEAQDVILKIARSESTQKRVRMRTKVLDRHKARLTTSQPDSILRCAPSLVDSLAQHCEDPTRAAWIRASEQIVTLALDDQLMSRLIKKVKEDPTLSFEIYFPDIMQHVVKMEFEIWPLHNLDPHALIYAFKYATNLRQLTLTDDVPYAYNPTLAALASTREPSILGPKLEYLQVRAMKCDPGPLYLQAMDQLIGKSCEQLRTLTMDQMYVKKERHLERMVRLKTLSLTIRTEEDAQVLLQQILPAISGKDIQLQHLFLSITFPNDIITEELFPILSALSPSLTKLHLSISYSHSKVRAMSNEALNEFRRILRYQTKLITTQSLPQLEVFSLYVNTPRDIFDRTIPNYQYYLNSIFLPCVFKCAVRMRKFILEVPNSLLPENVLKLDLKGLGSVGTLMLVYTHNGSLAKRAEKVFKLVEPEPGSVKFSNRIKILTLKDLPVLNAAILANIAQHFPCLTELNIWAFDEKVYGTKEEIPYVERTFDGKIAHFLDSLPSLRILRFTDDYAKHCDFVQSVAKLRMRGKESPVILRVPLNEENRMAAHKLVDEYPELFEPNPQKWINIT